jgi:glycosyltransferase involved in cell wall biosynthesis
VTKPRVLFVSRERFRLPLDDAQRQKWDAVGDVLDYRVVAAARAGSPVRTERFTLASPSPALDGPLYYARLPLRIARELRTFRPEVAVVQGVHEATAFLAARRLAGSRAALVLDVHGDWHEATRMYGSSWRRLLNPLSDAMGTLAVRRADAIRTISPFTSSLVSRHGRQPAGEFAAFLDVETFRGPVAPLPARPRVLFVGVLERIKGFDVLAASWQRVREALPDAELHVVGTGTLASVADELAGGGAEWTASADRAGIVDALDRATLLCLPSRAEGLGRVVIEAMLRGRAVVGADAGGIPDLVDDDRTGVLAAPGDPASLAAALLRVLGDGALASRLGGEARRKADEIVLTPEQYAARVADVVRAALAG